MADKTQRLAGKCPGCPDKDPDAAFPDGWHKPCSKYDAAERLCGQIDLNLISLLPKANLETLRDLSNKISQNVLRVNISPPDAPTSEDDFIDWVKSAHEEIFRPVPEIAGRFRTHDVAFGGHGIHRRTGYSPNGIEPAMRSLFGRYTHLITTYTNEPFLAMAGVLQRIFEIHPFADGNGRIGRLLVASIASQRGYVLLHSRDDAQTKYLDALTYAHRGLARESEARGPFFTPQPEKQALAPLAEYLKSVCVEVWDLEEEPPE